MATKQAHKPKIAHESIEAKHSSTSVSGALQDIHGDVLHGLWDSLLGGSAKNLAEQFPILGPVSKGHGDMKPGEPVHLNKKQEKAHAPRSEGHMEYFRKVQNADVLSQRKEDSSMDRKVEEIRLEIKKLMQTSKQLDSTLKQVTVEQRVVNAGVYHENFFHFVLSLLRSARIRMEEGMNWANTAKAKKGKQSKKSQNQYWNMEKKHGTSFSLSSERSTATQTG